MPYADEFDTAAAALDRAAQQAGALMEPARGALAEGVMVGGRLTEVVTDGLDSVAVLLDEVTAELTRLAQTCRERAELCRQALMAQQEYDAAYTGYEVDLRQWQLDGDGHAPEPPAAPSAPPVWANR